MGYTDNPALREQYERMTRAKTYFTVGVKRPAMGDTGDGEQVVLDASGATLDESGVTRIPVTSHRCMCGAAMVWDDGYQLGVPGAAGASCTAGCGYTFNTETVAT